ncbi:40S ribosomal protein S5-like protein, partial [Tanacetum coccineum]
PLRRVNQAIYLLTAGSRESAFGNVKTVAQCLADELINATKFSSNRVISDPTYCIAFTSSKRVLEVAGELQNQIEQDYEICPTIRDKVIPPAVSWFTGEAVEEDEFEVEEEEEDDDDEEEDEEDEEQKENKDMVLQVVVSELQKGSIPNVSPGGEERPLECKQQ